MKTVQATFTETDTCLLLDGGKVFAELKNFSIPGEIPSHGWRIKWSSGLWSGWHKGYCTWLDAQRAAISAAN